MKNSNGLLRDNDVASIEDRLDYLRRCIIELRTAPTVGKSCSSRVHLRRQIARLLCLGSFDIID